ncbi:MAG: nitroreductase family protein [Chloroflexota bacterium]
MIDDIGLFEAIDTQRALRYIKADPVPEEMVQRILEAAIKAPSGGNRQPWAFIVVRDRGVKEAIGAYYKKAWDETYGSAPDPGALGGRSYRSAAHLAEHIADAPVWIIACLRHDGTPGNMLRGGSIYPAVQNMLLAARGLGLASALTSLHTRYEGEVSEILGLPDNVSTAALLPIGYPDGVKYGPPRRAPLEEVVHYDSW